MIIRLKALSMIVIAYIALASTVYGQGLDSGSDAVKKNAVKISSVFMDNSEYAAFGFIFSEEEDALNVVTVCELIKSIADSSIRRGEARLMDGRSVPVTDIVKFYPDYNLAMLKVEKPDGFQWNEKFKSAIAEINDSVWILGRTGEWNEPTQEYIGRISDAAYSKIKIQTSGERKGMLGASVIKNGRIVGMVTNDQGDQLTALPIEAIKSRAYSWLSIKAKDDALTTPYFIVGGSLGFMYPVSKDMARMKVFAPDFGYFIEAGLFSPFSIRVESNFNKFVSSPYNVSGQTFEFRHRFSSLTFKLQLLESSDYETQLNSTIFLGYSNISANPTLRINGGEWISLMDWDEFQFQYSQKAHYVFIGGGANKILLNRVILGLEAGIGFSTGKYLSINPLKPFAENKHNDWLIYLRMGTGFIFGNKTPKYRFLR